MSENNLKTNLRYYGISPWEIEVIYSYLNARFSISQEEIEADDEDFVSFLEWDIPLSFNEEFFEWFEYKRWEQIKAVFKEMKRRRGSGNAIKIKITKFPGFLLWLIQERPYLLLLNPFLCIHAFQVLIG